MAGYRKIKVEERDDRITKITLAYPERRNAIGPVMANELLYALDEAKGSVIVLAAEGKAFCSGGDFAEMTSGGGGVDAERPSKGDYADLLLAMVRSDKPIVAMVHGAAMGGGLGLVAASTLAIASKEAQLGTPEISVGLFPMMIMAVLARLVPRRRLLAMMLLGEKMSADEGLVAGLVNEVVPADALEARTFAVAKKLAGNSPLTTKLGLRAYVAQEGLDLAAALPMLRERLMECLSTDDAREGLMAFLEKRPPVWKGT